MTGIDNRPSVGADERREDLLAKAFAWLTDPAVEARGVSLAEFCGNASASEILKQSSDLMYLLLLRELRAQAERAGLPTDIGEQSSRR
jgi:hypothetical protein